MTAPVRHSELRLDPLEVFKLRCWARAYLWAACELDLHQAVDVLQADAVRDGLVDTVGQSEVQSIMADAFHRMREASHELG
jgi:hypothetical protein